MHAPDVTGERVRDKVTPTGSTKCIYNRAVYLLRQRLIAFGAMMAAHGFTDGNYTGHTKMVVKRG